MLRPCLLTMITSLLAIQLYAQQPYNLRKPTGRSKAANPFFALHYHGDSTVAFRRVLHLYHHQQRFLTVLMSKPAHQKVATITQVLIRDTAMVQEFPNRFQDSILRSYTVHVVDTDNVDVEYPVEYSIVIEEPLIVKDTTDSVPSHKSNYLHKLQGLFKVSGSIQVDAQASDGRYASQLSPTTFVRTYLTVNPEIGGLPFNLSYLHTTENNAYGNTINNLRFSFNYQQYAQRMREKLDAKLKERAGTGLKTSVPYNIEEVNREYAKLKDKFSGPSFQRQLEKNRELLKYGETDTAFRRTYRYKRAKMEMDSLPIQMDRLRALDSLRVDYQKYEKLNTTTSGVINYESFKSPRDYRRAIKRHGLASNGGQWMLDVKQFDIGTFNPNYNTLVLNGVSITGLNVEVNPGQLYGAFVWGNLYTNYSNPFSFDYTGKRSLMAGRIGLGRTDRFLMSITVSKAQDEGSKLLGDSLNAYRPAYNYVFGIDMRYRVQSTEVGAEYAKSLVPDKQTEGAGNYQYPFSRLFEKNGDKQQSGAWAVYGTTRLKETNTQLKVTARAVDPYYYSYGAPFLRQDNFRLESKVAQPLMKQKLNFSFTYRFDRDNLYKQKEGTSRNHAFIYTAQVKIKRYPIVSLMYATHLQYYYDYSNKNTVNNKIQLGQITLTNITKKRNWLLVQSATGGAQRIETPVQEQRVLEVYQLGLNEQYQHQTLNLGITADASYVWSNGNDTGNVYAGGLTLSKGVFKNKITVLGGYHYQEDVGIETRHIAEAGASFVLPMQIKCSIRVERHFIASNQINRNDQIVGRLSMFKTF